MILLINFYPIIIRNKTSTKRKRQRIIIKLIRLRERSSQIVNRKCKSHKDKSYDSHRFRAKKLSDNSIISKSSNNNIALVKLHNAAAAVAAVAAAAVSNFTIPGSRNVARRFKTGYGVGPNGL